MSIDVTYEREAIVAFLNREADKEEEEGWAWGGSELWEAQSRARLLRQMVKRIEAEEHNQ